LSGDLFSDYIIAFDSYQAKSYTDNTGGYHPPSMESIPTDKSARSGRDRRKGMWIMAKKTWVRSA